MSKILERSSGVTAIVSAIAAPIAAHGTAVASAIGAGASMCALGGIALGLGAFTLDPFLAAAGSIVISQACRY